MPGICGLVSVDAEKEKLQAALQQMVNPLLRDSKVQTSHAVEPGFAIATVAIDASRPVCRENGTVLAITGEVVDADRLVNRVRSAGVFVEPSPTLANTLLQAYLCFGLDVLCGLNGVYTIALWESQQKKLTLITDRMGIGKLYFWQIGKNIYFSSEQKSICLLPEFKSEIDELGVADFLIAENVLEDRTFFTDIKIADGAQILIFQGGQLSKKRYWDYSFYQYGDTILRPDVYIDGLAYLLRKAVVARVRPNTVLLLTGGLDSRSVAAAWVEVAPDIPFQTNTIGQAGSRDLRRAKEIAKALNLQHAIIPVSDTYLADYSRECVWRTEGNINVHASWIFAEDAYFKSRNVIHAMTGINGDMVGGRFRLPELIKARQQNELENYFKNRPWLGFSLARSLLRPEVFRRVDGSTYQSLWNLTQLAGTRIPLHQYDYMDLHAFVRREATSVDVLSDNAWVLDPYMDNDLLDFVFNQPPEYRNGSYLYKKMIVKHFSRVSSIGYGNDDTSLSLQVASEDNQSIKWLTRTGRRIRNRLSPDTEAGLLDGDRSTWTVPLNGSIRSGSRTFVEEVFGASEYYDDIFDVKAVKQLLADHNSGRINDFKAVGSILTFALWRRMFAEKQSYPSNDVPGLNSNVEKFVVDPC